GLRASRFELLPCEGTYFVLARYGAISNETEAEFVRTLVTRHGVAAIPIAGFYLRPFEAQVVRFCFAKKDDTLRAALERLVTVWPARCGSEPPSPRRGPSTTANPRAAWPHTSRHQRAPATRRDRDRPADRSPRRSNS